MKVLGEWKNVCVQGEGTGLLRLEERTGGCWIALYTQLSASDAVQEKASAAVDIIKEDPGVAAGAALTAAASSAVKSIAVALGADRSVMRRTPGLENECAKEFSQAFAEANELAMRKRVIFERYLGDLTNCSLSGTTVSFEIGRHYRLTFEDRKSGENMSQEFFEALERIRDQIKSARLKQGIKWTLDANGLLTINGWGEMPDWKYYSDDCTPWYERRNDIKAVRISAGFVNIGSHAFYQCENLTRVDIPDSVTVIGDSAFGRCKYLNNIHIPNSVTRIGHGGFKGCVNLANIHIPNRVTAIECGTFEECANLRNIVIPSGVTRIGSWAFRLCTNLDNIHIPSSVTSIESLAFEGCVNLVSIYIPNGVTEIGNSTFTECANLRNIVISDSVTTIGDHAFSECNGLTEIRIPNSVKKLGLGVFSKCNNLKRVYLPKHFDGPLFSLRFGVSKEKVTFT